MPFTPPPGLFGGNGVPNNGFDMDELIKRIDAKQLNQKKKSREKVMNSAQSTNQ